jgi:hypothetical protein
MTTNRVGANQCILSYRLLKLLQWLLEHEQESLKKIIAKAYSHGVVLDTLNGDDSLGDQFLEEELHETVIDYFGLLEILLSEVVEEDTERARINRKLLPALDKIDNSFCDKATVVSTVQKVSSSRSHGSQAMTKELLFKELLKQWKPIKKDYAH